MSDTKASAKSDIPIVALGASAGGLEAFEAFFKHMPNDSGIAFIVLAHLSPDHVSILPQLIQKCTPMQVQPISNNMPVHANQVYVIPPNQRLSIKHGKLQLQALREHRTSHLPIDSFFASLANDQGDKAICIVLSGTGNDGAEGITIASELVGLILAQDQLSAKFQGMPASAVATGLVDHVMSPEQMPARLMEFASTYHQHAVAKPPVSARGLQKPLSRIYELLRNASGNDFSLYKENTLNRRIERRMQIHHMDDINDFADLLENNSNEVEYLFDDLLIGVTDFFRDPDVFEALREQFLPRLLERKQKNDSFRVWVTGCSSGEEAYSLGIVLEEAMVKMKLKFPVQIFATDLDKHAINVARTGLYHSSITESVSPERLKRHFIKEVDGQYRVKKSLREKVTFAIHNVIQDPPFTKLDMLSCRNLLIYFGANLQKKLLPYFHYSLSSSGLLILGSSETIGQHANLFNVLDKKNKIFERNESITKIPRSLSLYSRSIGTKTGTETMPINNKTTNDINSLDLVETLLKQSDMQPCAVVDEQNNILYIHGSTGKFLEPAQGKISVNILEMAKSGLKVGLSKALLKVADTNKQSVIKSLTLNENNTELTADIIVKPIQQHPQRLTMVVFSEKSKTNGRRKSTPAKQKDQLASELEYELQITRNTLHATIAELETANEELKSSNEELQSTNEELQSTNEEIETSKEELQSLNEESSSVNTELQSRIDELSKSNDDIKNLLDSTQIATLFLDVDLGVRRFTPKIKDIIALSASDTGRPIQHFAINLIDVDLVKYSNKVLDNLNVLEAEVTGTNRQIYIMKVRPYRTLNNVIDGVVITFEDATERHLLNESLRNSEARYRMLFELANDAIVMLDPMTGAFIEANSNAYDQLGYSRQEFLSMHLSDVIVNITQDELLEKIRKNIINVNTALSIKQHAKTGEIIEVNIKAKQMNIGDKPSIMSTWLFNKN